MSDRKPGHGSYYDDKGIRTDIRVKGGDAIVTRSQDVAPILEHNKELQKAGQKSDWGRHIASIPVMVLEQWIQETGVDFYMLNGADQDKFLKKYLNDPAWAYLRTDNKDKAQWNGAKFNGH